MRALARCSAVLSPLTCDPDRAFYRVYCSRQISSDSVVHSKAEGRAEWERDDARRCGATPPRLGEEELT